MTDYLKIGIDFDNTIACYTPALAKLVDDQNLPIDRVFISKKSISSYCKRQPNGNLRWSELQGALYGDYIQYAKPYQGLKEFLRVLSEASIPFCIISHKTVFPAVGYAYPLQQAAIRWLTVEGFFDDPTISLHPEQCFFEVTLDEKLKRIEKEGCTHFIDDLIDVLGHGGFPQETERILFNDRDDAFPCCLEWGGMFSMIERLKPLKQNLLVSCSKVNIDQESSLKDLYEAKYKTPLKSLIPLSGGANNRVYQLIGDAGVVIGKAYFFASFDTRNRLEHECAFLGILNDCGSTSVPMLISKDQENNTALFEYIPGFSFTRDTIDVEPIHWQQCLEFITEIQGYQRHPLSLALPDASEAAFSLAGHLAWVHRRRDDWLYMAQEGMISESLASYIQGELEDQYQSLAKQLIRHPDFKKTIPQAARVISPSDFGLHNALLQDAKLYFIDFEYAGWDDPAKLIADFFCQPQVSPPPSLFNVMVKVVKDLIPSDEQSFFEERRPLVQECIQLKWVYIKLNKEHPKYIQRRVFAGVP